MISQLPTNKFVGLSREAQRKNWLGSLRKLMQKLLKRDTHPPWDAPQVPSSVTLSVFEQNRSMILSLVSRASLNREETLSEQSLKTLDNSPEGNQSQCTERSIKPFMYTSFKRTWALSSWYYSFMRSHRLRSHGLASLDLHGLKPRSFGLQEL